MADEIIRILSIDGGGVRGIIPARLLQRIEESIGELASTLFHLIAGTSTGGILGCGLAKGKPAREIGDLYAKRGGEIFHRSLWDKVTTIDGLSNPDYDPTPLETILGEELGGTWLSEGRGAELMVPSYAIQLPPASRNWYRQSATSPKPTTATPRPSSGASARSRVPNCEILSSTYAIRH
jgi:patatin-like phospholipase/acyl hydrolase